MHPRTRELLDHLDRTRAELRAAVGLVPAAQIQRRPADDRWSAAEVVEHLVIVEGRVAGLVIPALQDLAARGARDEQTLPVLSAVDVDRFLDRTRPVKAGDASQPSSALAFDEAWAALEARRTLLRQALTEGDGLALGSVTVEHPRLGALDLYQWLVFLGAHEARHAAQVKEIAAVFDGR